MSKHTIIATLLVSALAIPGFAYAQGAPVAPAPAVAAAPAPTTNATTATPAVSADYEQRLALSRKMHEIRPTSRQIEAAIDLIAEKVPLSDRAKFKARALAAIDQKKLEETSVNAMAEVFTNAELQAMIDYYSKAEARSIAEKMTLYQGMIQPEITKMMDKAMLDLRTGVDPSQTPAAAPAPAAAP